MTNEVEQWYSICFTKKGEYERNNWSLGATYTSPASFIERIERAFDAEVHFMVPVPSPEKANAHTVV